MTNLWERTNLQTAAYFSGTNFWRKLASNYPAFKDTICRETGMPWHQHLQGRKADPCWWIQRSTLTFLILIIGDTSAWFVTVERRDTCKIDLREWPRAWQSATSFIISCLLRQETFFRPTVTVVGVIDTSFLVFVWKKDYICVNLAPLFLYLYEIWKNLEEHGASVVKSS